jgi:hypothetical protein
MIDNCKIISTQLGTEDHGVLTCYIMVEGDGWGCGFGGYALDDYNPVLKMRLATAKGFQAITEILKVVGVENWEDLKGQYIRAEHQGCGGGIMKIGHLMKDQWFSFKEFFQKETEVTNNAK